MVARFCYCTQRRFIVFNKVFFNIFCHSERSRGISWKRFFLLPRGTVLLLFKFCSARGKIAFFFTNHLAVIPSEVEESRGNGSFFFPAARYCYCLVFYPRVVRLRFFYKPPRCHSERSRGISWKRTRRLEYHNTSF